MGRLTGVSPPERSIEVAAYCSGAGQGKAKTTCYGGDMYVEARIEKIDKDKGEEDFR